MMTPNEIERRTAFMQWAANYAAETMVAADCGQVKPLAEISGAVFYGGYDTLRRGRVYFLGLNPGGPPDKSRIGHFLKIPEAASSFNQYWNGKWGCYPPGGTLLQKRVRKLFCALSHCRCGGDKNNADCPGRKICAANLIFPRSCNLKHLGQLYDKQELVDKCWPVHKRLIEEIVQPRLILICNDYGYFQLKRNLATDAEEEVIDAKHGNWKCRAFNADFYYGKIRIVRFPHLSWYALESPSRAGVMEWIKGKLA